MANEKIVLGSGKLYVMEYTNTIPEDATIETDVNLLGLISGGASLKYTPTFYECKDDLGLMSKKIMTDEECILESGIMTWNGNTLKKLCSTARVTEDSVKKMRTVKIGGIKNQDGKKYVVQFVHKDVVNGDVRVTIIGSNEAGFEMAFAKDKETVINAQFKAQPHDVDGTLVIFKEAIPAV